MIDHANRDWVVTATEKREIRFIEQITLGTHKTVVLFHFCSDQPSQAKTRRRLERMAKAVSDFVGAAEELGLSGTFIVANCAFSIMRASPPHELYGPPHCRALEAVSLGELGEFRALGEALANAASGVPGASKKGGGASVVNAAKAAFLPGIIFAILRLFESMLGMVVTATREGDTDSLLSAILCSMDIHVDRERWINQYKRGELKPS